MTSRSSVPMDKGVPRYAHGSRVPGWDTPADLDKDPATIPGPADPTVPVPTELRAEIEAHMALYPDTRSATLPALEAAQRVHGWCSPEAIEQVACVMRLTPADLAAVATFYDMLETEPVGRHSVYVCTNISCSLCGADELLAACRRPSARPPARTQSSTCARSSASARATSRRWPLSTACTSARSRSRTCRHCSTTCARDARCCPRSSSPANESPTRTPIPRTSRYAKPSTPRAR